jgi:hypothetical protein
MLSYGVDREILFSLFLLTVKSPIVSGSLPAWVNKKKSVAYQVTTADNAKQSTVTECVGLKIDLGFNVHPEVKYKCQLAPRFHIR